MDDQSVIDLERQGNMSVICLTPDTILNRKLAGKVRTIDGSAAIIDFAGANSDFGDAAFRTSGAHPSFRRSQLFLALPGRRCYLVCPDCRALVN